MAKKKRVLKKKAVAKRRAPRITVPAALAALERHGFFVREAVICEEGEAPTKCAIHYDDGPWRDPKSYSCRPEGHHECWDGTECKPRVFGYDGKEQFLACCPGPPYR